jgi:hypothetical protein
MKKIVLAFAALAILVACKNEDQSDANVHIDGNIKGFKKGTLFIQRFKDTAMVNIDTIVINGDSRFESHLKLDSPEMLYLVIDRVKTNSVDDNLPFFAEPGTIKIETSKDAFFSQARITGSKNQKVYEEFLALKKRTVDDNLELVKKEFEARKDNNRAALDSLSIKSEQNLKRRYLITANFALNHATTDVGPFLALSEIPDANIKYLDTIQKSMSPVVAKSHYGKMLTKYVADRKKEAAAPVQ